MNRRRFLSLLAVAPVAAKLAPLLPGEPDAIHATLGGYNNYYSESSPEIFAAIEQYSDYVNFSDFSATEPFSPEILAISKQLGDALMVKMDEFKYAECLV